MKNLYIKWFIAVFAIPVLSTYIIGCGEEIEPYNEFDPESPNYVRPQVNIKDSSANRDGQLSFILEETNPGKRQFIEYRHKLSNATNSTDWSWWIKLVNESSIVYAGLDEGVYTLEIQSNYLDRHEKHDEDIVMQNIKMNVVPGPALMISKRITEVSQGQNFKVRLIADDVVDLMLAYAVITYDPLILKNTKIEKDSFFASNKGTIVFFGNLQNEGKIEINSGVAVGTPPGVDGSGSIAGLTFTALKPGKTELKIERESKLRNSSNMDIPIRELVNGIIEIK